MEELWIIPDWRSLFVLFIIESCYGFMVIVCGVSSLIGEKLFETLFMVT